VHSGPKPTRHFADQDLSKHDEMDTCLPAFRAAVTEDTAGPVVCSYNAINGQPGTGAPAVAHAFHLNGSIT
jgi:beta-glucosidase